MAGPLNSTPNGCQIDNGRCFERLEWEEETQSVYAYFRDGSEYRYFGIERQLALDWIAMIDPGCFLNHQLWPGQFIRTRPPR